MLHTRKDDLMLPIIVRTRCSGSASHRQSKENMLGDEIRCCSKDDRRAKWKPVTRHCTFQENKRQPRACSPSVEMRSGRSSFKSFTLSSTVPHCRVSREMPLKEPEEGRDQLEWRETKGPVVQVRPYKDQTHQKMLRRYLAECMWSV